MTTPWHVPAALAARYAAAAATDLEAWSVEKHVESCTRCAAHVSAAVRATEAAEPLASLRAALLANVREDAREAGATARETRPLGPGRPPRPVAPAREPGTVPGHRVRPAAADAAAHR
ncbi:MAG TPA: hypothetical protein VIU94_15370, partial [Streptomyces sp.]